LAIGQARIKAAVCRDTITHCSGGSRVRSAGDALVLSLQRSLSDAGGFALRYHLAHRLPTALSLNPAPVRMKRTRRFYLR
jgi:hypothetical protein